MALANDVQYTERNGDQLEYGVLTNIRIYGGAATAITAAKVAVPVGHGSAVKFVGFAEERVDNTGGATGDRTVRVNKKIRLIPLSATVANMGAAVYATDDNTFTLDNTGSPLQVGTVWAVDTAGTWLKPL